MKRRIATILLTGACLTATAPSAMALDALVSGICQGTELRRVPTVMTKQGTGNVDMNYYNCIGAFDNNELRIGLVKAGTTSQFTSSRVLTGCGRVYNLGTGIQGTTRFQIQYRSAVALWWNADWEGRVYF